MLDLVESMVLPELLQCKQFSDSRVPSLLEGLNYFAPVEPYFRASILSGPTQPVPTSFSKKMTKVTQFKTHHTMVIKYLYPSYCGD